MVSFSLIFTPLLIYFLLTGLFLALPFVGGRILAVVSFEPFFYVLTFDCWPKIILCGGSDIYIYDISLIFRPSLFIGVVKKN